MWGPHSLGHVWRELAALPSGRNQPPLGQRGDLFSFGRERERLLAERVRRLTFEQGGASVPQLLEWTQRLKWTHEEFFATLQQAIDLNLIQERQGVLVG
jgi:hypothetical protein